MTGDYIAVVEEFVTGELTRKWDLGFGAYGGTDSSGGLRKKPEIKIISTIGNIT